MTDEKWTELRGRIQDTFPVEEHYTEELDGGPGTREVLIFQGHAGRMKLERITRPVILSTRALHAKRMGATATLQHEYSDTEFTDTVVVSVWKDSEWVGFDQAEGFLKA